MLLSGPNGVGKSGVGLLSYLLCAARCLPVVYLSRTETWVQAAQRGEGDAYLLRKLWQQNADLIAASEPLRGVFAAALQDDAESFTPNVMDKLRSAIRWHHLGLGVILDEVQHITAAVHTGAAAPPSSPPGVAGSYFRLNWHDWMNDNNVFARMSIASAHGEREYKLPSGESHRLHIIEPLTDDQRVALLSHQSSPAFVSDTSDHERIRFFSGNILRTLMEVTRALPSYSAGLQAELSRRLGKFYESMQDDCARWLASLPERERNEAAETCMELLSGKRRWSAAKGLYDAGIMYRTAGSEFLRPVSAAASSAYLTRMAEYIRGASTPLSMYTDGRLRGFALEKQVLARLSTVDTLVGTKLLDGTHGDALHLRSSYVLPFVELDEVVPREAPVLYRPISLTYSCDGILMPAADDNESVVIVLECSVINPRSADRVDKVLKLLKPNGVVTVLSQRFQNPLRQIHIAIMYDGDLEEGRLNAHMAALSHGELPPITPAAADPEDPAPAATSIAATSAAATSAAAPAPATKKRRGQGKDAPVSAAHASAIGAASAGKVVQVFDRARLVMLGGVVL